MPRLPDKGSTSKSPMPPSPPHDGRPPKEIFLENLPVIREIIAHCARRFSPQDGEDFSQTVMARLIEEDYRILREFKGRSSLRTYLATAIKRMLLDYQNHLWGKWHPSAEAKRLGPTAVWLERLRYRDKLSFEEACRVILGDDPEVSRANLELFEAKIAARIPRHFVGEEHLESEADKKLRPDERLEAKELAGLSRRVFGVLFVCIKLLDPEDRTLLWLRQELSVAEIARVQTVDQKPLYRRLVKIYWKLEKELGRRGVRRQEIEEILRRLRPDFLDF
jgi:RNA polymerase sigma factor (sigma-70 family)